MSELIERIAAIRATWQEPSYTDPWNVLTEMRDRINALPTAPRWHRVEEPPKEEGKYLVCDGRGNYFVAWWGQRLGWCYDPKFFCYWMPIEPPKEVRDGKEN